MRKFALALVCLFSFSIPAFSQATVTPLILPRWQFLDATGNPLAGGFVNTYAAGTSTPQATYADNTGLILNSNPVTLDSTGAATIWLGTNSYRICVKNAASVQQWCADNVPGAGVASTVTAITAITGPNFLNGNTDITQNTAATSGANQSSYNFCIDGSYWTGSSSAKDKWCWASSMGTGTNPTSTLNLTHSGSPGAASFELPNATFSGPNPQIDVTSFGAKCDGSTDDTVAIQAAINSAVSNGGIVNFPSNTAGFCVIAGNITLAGRAGITLRGPNMYSEIGSQSKSGLTFTGTTSPSLNLDNSISIKIENLQITNNNAGFSGTLIHLDGAWNTRIINDNFAGPSSGAMANVISSTAGTTENVVIEGCSFNQAIVAIAGGNQDNKWVISDSLFSASAGVGTISGSEITTPGQAWTIENNIFEMFVTSPAHIVSFGGGGGGFKFIGNWVGDTPNAFVGPMFLNVTSGAEFSGNWMYGGTSSQLMGVVSGADGVSITGNYIQGFAQIFNMNAANNQTGITLLGNTMNTIASTFNGGSLTSGIVQDNTGGGISMFDAKVGGGGNGLADIGLNQTWTGTDTNMKLVTPTITSPTINTGISNGTGLKHASICASSCDITATPCTATGGSYSQCTFSASWTGSAFADANYKVVLTGVTPSSGQCGAPYITAKSTTAITIGYSVMGSGSCSYTEIDAVAMHN